MGTRQSIFIGERFQNKAGSWFEVIKYDSGKKITVKFDESGYEKVVEGQEIRRGCIVDVLTKYPAKGEVYEMNQNGKLEILEYHGAQNVVVRFLDTGFTTRTEACQIKRGTVKDNLLARVGGAGFMGDGPHSGYDSDGAVSWAYLKWHGMFKRCYSPGSEQMAITYQGVTICDEWHNFQNFAEWAKVQVGYDNRLWALEKDLLIRGNKIYAPDRCCFLPQELNNQMLKAEKSRGDWPIGVHMQKSNGRFIAHLQGWREDSETSHIGMFDTPEEAFYAYKVEKEKKLKNLATKWRSQIDVRAYEALVTYEVLITD